LLGNMVRICSQSIRYSNISNQSKDGVTLTLTFIFSITPLHAI
jgi:hypothetical protein